MSALPACAGACMAGQEDLGYIYAAVYDQSLNEVRP